MNALIPVTPAVSGEAAPAPGRELCAAAGLNEGLAERLTLDGAGRPFAPAAIELADPAQLAGQLDLLLRVDPAGGFEPLLLTNRNSARDAALAQLRRRLAGGAEIGSARALLEDLLPELRRLLAQLELQAAAAERAYAAAHGALRAWQEASGRSPGLLRNFAGWLLGGPEQISLPQAAVLWNERERLALGRAAAAAAIAVVGAVIDEAAALLDRQEALLRAARSAASQAGARWREPSPGELGRDPWSWHGSPQAVAGGLAAEPLVERLAAELLGRVAAGGELERLGQLAAELAQAEADRLLPGLSLARCVELEAGADAGLDPLVLIGQRLLGELEARPSWRLRRSARPRLEVVQVSADGEPIYRLDGLGAAAYGDGIERLGFVRVELGVATDDLQLMHESEEAFRALLAQRNIFVLEELAAAAPSSPALNGLAAVPGEGARHG